MKYMILMNATPEGLKEFGKMTQADFVTHVKFMHDLNEDLRKRGEWVVAEGLTGPEEARIVRAREGGGAPIVTDGPFAEGKEFLAGFWIVDVKSLERAIELCGYISTAPGPAGKSINFPVELRPVGQAPA
ncbi:MAG TPA: YciI family protein [Kofleriaceae bacterium]|nr:YciI family protein [Kofleriaceae bacterium]